MLSIQSNHGPMAGTGLAAIEAALADLVRRYAREPSLALAQSVARHCEALCGHPEVRDPETYCAYRRLARHWGFLARLG
jgi:hypothetical protein